MGRNNDKTLKEAINQYLDALKLRKKFDETAILAAWPDLMGPAIANRTKQLFIRDQKLFVRVESAVIKNELLMLRSQIVGKMNEHVGRVVIEEIVIL